MDRFSEDAGTLMVRDTSNGLPAANEAIDYDEEPFITKGFGPNGETVEYYNFDVQSTTPAPIYVLFAEGETNPVSGQLNIIDVIPGDNGYNDFWLVNKVTVPADYKANSVTGKQAIMDMGYTIEETNTIVNCPVVPAGSTASQRIGTGSKDLTRGWYKGKVCYYFSFEERGLETTSSDEVLTSPIYVTFKTNGVPSSGFMTDSASTQTHNVVATLPTDGTYSPLWEVKVYDNADFSSVMDLTTAAAANILDPSAAKVNCPIVSVVP